MNYLLTEILNGYRIIMDSRYNPLSSIPDMHTRHIIMQALACVWCMVFSFWVGSIIVFGVSLLIHAFLLAGIFITLAIFETANRNPQYFKREQQYLPLVGGSNGTETRH